MADLDLSQSEADALIGMEKRRTDEKIWQFPGPGERVNIPLSSADKRETFILDVTRVRVKLSKVTYQNRARGSVVLMRLDIDGSPHRNPDGEEVPCPHIHLYREGFADKWAYPIPLERYPRIQNFTDTLSSFMQHCNIKEPPQLNYGLF